jgi:predicted DNA-binding protein with PD1-like motif
MSFPAHDTRLTSRTLGTIRASGKQGNRGIHRCDLEQSCFSLPLLHRSWPRRRRFPMTSSSRLRDLCLWAKAPAMQAKLVKNLSDEQVYSIIFYEGDEVMSGLTDFAIAHKISDAHFTAIGAVSGATLAWLDIPKKMYRRIAVKQQVEVVSLIGDIAVFKAVPVIHMHAVLCKTNGSTIGGHVFELTSNPTVEVFLTVNTTVLKKKADDASGMKLIDPTQ